MTPHTSHDTGHAQTCANPYNPIDATEPFRSALRIRFLTLGLDSVRLKFSLSFRKQLLPYDRSNNIIILGAGEFIPYEPRPFVVVSELKTTGLPYCALL